tara:strand:+ start:137 stop:1186 length:1050 start_codon:yes stop_codon:yes gene_type:complete
MSRKQLVTGGAGFIGANYVLQALDKTQDTIIILDKLTYAGDVRRLEPHLSNSDRLVFIKGDICDKKLLNSLFSKHEIDTVVHFAAESHVDRSISGPDVFVQTNVNGTVALLSAAKESWDSYHGKRFIHVSTDEVYGTLMPDDPPFTESNPYKPNSPYASSKASADLFVRAWVETYDFPAIITNCSNNYGPWQFPEKLLPLMIQNALDGRKLPVYGDGKQVRDWIHVEDHCNAILKVIDKGRLGETYIIGGRQERFNIDIVNLICEHVGEYLGNDIKNLISYVKDRLGHDRRYAVDSLKIETELGWSQLHRFEEDLPLYIKWIIDNKDWMNSIRDDSYQDYYFNHYGKGL